jgi:non-ribosomal peptide synthetase component E (peptide arylation enzyme)
MKASEEQLIEYTESSQIVTASGTIESNCNSIEFLNIGQDTVTVLGYPIQQGFSMTRPGNVGEINRTNYTAMFANAAGQTQMLLVIRKNY